MSTLNQLDSQMVAPQIPTLRDSKTRESASKAAVLDAAQRLINQYGYAGFSMRDLAQESGLAKATLYHHFEDKREIFRQVLQRDLTYARDHLAAAATTSDDFETQLSCVVTAFFALAQARGLLLISTLREVSSMEPEFCTIIRGYRDELHRPITEMLNAAIAAGTIQATNADLATMSILGILQVAATRHLLLDDMELDEHAVKFIVDFILNGLSVHATDTSPVA